MEKIVIFGASGGTGRQIVEQALQGGCQVTAFVRHTNSFSEHSRLRFVVGDVQNLQAVSSAIAGQDAVLSALGPSRSDEPICENGTRAILAGMSDQGVRRLVALSAYGASESHHGFYSFIVWTLLKSKMYDKERMEVLIRDSATDWTLVRPPALTNGPRSGAYRAATTLPIKITSSISRADLADFMLREAHDCKHLHEAPAIAQSSSRAPS